MDTATITIRTDPDIKEKACAVLETLGLDLQTAGNLFYRQVVLRKGIPFALATDASPCNGKTPRVGGWEGRFTVPDNFDEPLGDFREYM